MTAKGKWRGAERSYKGHVNGAESRVRGYPRGWSGTVIMSMIIIFLFPFSYKILFRYKSKSPKEGEVKNMKCSESSTQPYIVPVKMFKYVRKAAVIELKCKTCTIICVTCVKMTNANDLQ